MQMYILVVNINNLAYTQELFGDLMRQTHQFDLTIVDQGSTESGTDYFLSSLADIPYVKVIRNQHNVDLNRVWNAFYSTIQRPGAYLCFLNNDVRIPNNYVEDTVAILETEKSVGAVIHPTNHPDYQNTTDLRYAIVPDGERITQGHDFTIRKEAFTLIPDELKVFGGDDWIFTQMYNKLWKTAVALSSPIIHYHAKSRKFYTGDRQEEAMALKRLGVERLTYLGRYNRKLPQFDVIKEGGTYRRKEWWRI